MSLPERDLLPESLAHDPGTGGFYIGSMHWRKIVRRSVDGRVFYVATAQLGAIRPGGRVAPADSMRENVVLRVPVPR